MRDGAPLKRAVANRFVTEVEENHESTVYAACNANSQLVDAKLEMVRAHRLLYCGALVRRVRWLDTVCGLQCDEID